MIFPIDTGKAFNKTQNSLRISFQNEKNQQISSRKEVLPCDKGCL